MSRYFPEYPLEFDEWTYDEYIDDLLSRYEPSDIDIAIMEKENNATPNFSKLEKEIWGDEELLTQKLIAEYEKNEAELIEWMMI